MDTEEVLRIYNDMVKEFGDKLPNPEHEPLKFAYYIRLYMYEKQVKQDGSYSIFV
jgi:hypothetical protein